MQYITPLFGSYPGSHSPAPPRHGYKVVAAHGVVTAACASMRTALGGTGKRACFRNCVPHGASIRSNVCRMGCGAVGAGTSTASVACRPDQLRPDKTTTQGGKSHRPSQAAHQQSLTALSMPNNPPSAVAEALAERCHSCHTAAAALYVTNASHPGARARRRDGRDGRDGRAERTYLCRLVRKALRAVRGLFQKQTDLGTAAGRIISGSQK